MSSLPSNHTLLGGHEGALIWLERFLDLLPPPPSTPLPLLTAPVLVAFLTGAGHMLANKFESKFQSLYALIEQNVMNRLDDSPVGVPSATRLKKVVEGGFAGFKKTMPPGAVESLYDGNVGDALVTLPPVGGALGSSQSSSMKSPFGQAPSGASPFGQNAPTNPSPFGQAAAPSASPFGQAASTNPSPFGTAAPAASMNPSPFGSIPAASQTTSPFGQTASTNSMMDGDEQTTGFSTSNWGASGGFGGSTSSTPFDSSQTQASGAFGGQPNTFQTTQSNPSAFGFGASAAPAPSPFGSSAPAPSPFGGSAPAPSPFGAFSSQPQSNNPFGGAFVSSGKTPFSTSASSSFGSSNSGGVKKDTRLPCKFFSKGSCRYGANCRFSHGDSAPTGNNASFSSSSFGSSFGAGGGGFGNQNSNPSPFGGGTGFGGGSPFSSTTSNPFGGPRR